MPRVSATLRSRPSLVHRSVEELISTEAMRQASVNPMPRLYKRRASIMCRTSLIRGDWICGRRSSRAKVLARAVKDPKASSAIIHGWITIWPWFNAFRISLLPERKYSIQMEVSARICILAIFDQPADAECFLDVASSLPAKQADERFHAR
jgi:hypothetical protein